MPRESGFKVVFDTHTKHSKPRHDELAKTLVIHIQSRLKPRELLGSKLSLIL
jgi:hypothetical protein